MPEQSFATLRTELLESGISPRHVRRIVAELDDHLDDLKTEATSRGMSEIDAAGFAFDCIGDQQAIANRMLETSEFKTWEYRYPRIACVYLPVVYTLLLPAAPVFAGIANPGKVARWGAALMLSAGITAAMFLSMQLAIALT
jgi:hypothetical protein